MARLLQLPNKSIIDGFKGTIDFYVNRGQPCARKWPRKPHHPKTPEQVAHWNEFAWLNKLLPTLPANIHQAYVEEAYSGNVTWKDMANVLYFTDSGEDFQIL